MSQGFQATDKGMLPGLLTRPTPPRTFLKLGVALLLAVIYLLFQLHFMAQYIDWDQIAYLGNVRGSLRPGALPVFNPHHLHLEIGSKYFHLWMVEHFGEAGFTDLLFNNRLKSALAASLGVLFASLFFSGVTGRLAWGILGGILVGLCHGYLVYAAKFDTGIFPALGILMYLWILQRLERTRRWLLPTALLAGVILFIGLMFHQYLGIACVTFFFSMVVPPRVFDWHWPVRPFSIRRPEHPAAIDRRPLPRYRAALAMTFLCVVLTVSAYFWAGKTQYNLPFDEADPRPARGLFGKVLFQKWLFIYETADAWGKGLEEFDPRDPFRGYTDAFLARSGFKYSRTYRFDYNLASPRDPAALPANVLALFTLVTVFGTLFFLPGLLRRYRRSMFFLFTTTILQVIFSTYWESFYLEFWIVPGILICSLFVLLLNYWAEKLSQVKLRVLALACYLGLGLVIGVMGAHNLHEHLIPYSREQRLEVGGSAERKRYYRSLFSRSIYRYPDDPYRRLKPER